MFTPGDLEHLLKSEESHGILLPRLVHLAEVLVDLQSLRVVVRLFSKVPHEGQQDECLVVLLHLVQDEHKQKGNTNVDDKLIEVIDD